MTPTDRTTAAHAEFVARFAPFDPALTTPEPSADVQPGHDGVCARGPVARLYADGGAVVTRCSDPAEARRLLLPLLADDGYDDAELAEAFPVEKATVCRGRIVHCLPGSYGEGEGWSWQFHPGAGRGSTPAVEWASR